jgi:hypothetical protein
MTHYLVWMKGKEEHAATLDATSSFEARRIAAAASNVHIGKIMARAILEAEQDETQPPFVALASAVAPRGWDKAETSTEDPRDDAGLEHVMELEAEDRIRPSTEDQPTLYEAARKMPDTWDGHELRRYIADKFEEATITLKPGTKDAGYRRRLREYQAIRIERNL